MAEIAGLIGIVSFFQMSVNLSTAILSSQHHHIDGSSGHRIRLMVQRARLAQWGRLTGVQDSSTSDNVREVDPLILDILKQVYRTLLNADRLLFTYYQDPLAAGSYNSPNKLSTSRKVVWALRDKDRLVNEIAHLESLIDALYTLLPPLHGYESERYRSSMLQQPRTTPGETQEQSSVDDVPQSASPGDLDSRCFQMWEAAADGLKTLGKNGLASHALRRTFQRAGLRLKLWGEEFDFPIRDIDKILGSSAALYTHICSNLGNLTIMLYSIIVQIDPSSDIVSMKLRTQLGRCAGITAQSLISRANTSQSDASTSLVRGLPVGMSYKALAESETSETKDDTWLARRKLIEVGVQEEVNQELSTLYRMIGAIDHSYQRYLWRTRNKMLHEQKEIDLAHNVNIPVKRLLANNIEAASDLKLRISRSAKSNPSPTPLEVDIKTELDRLEGIMADVGENLDGNLAKRNPELQEAVGFTLEQMHLVLDSALKQASSQNDNTTILTSNHPNAFDSDEIKGQIKRTWGNLPYDRLQDIRETPPATSVESTVEELKQINDSLSALRTTIQYGDLPAYEAKPVQTNFYTISSPAGPREVPD
ncbi:hypothetical protein MMC18_000545 [Xylographa bjoerkii]|nr:hypothetical protein [Xylographa bjoerkii]